MRDVVHEVVREHGPGGDDEPGLLVQRSLVVVLRAIRVGFVAGGGLGEGEIRRRRRGRHRGVFFAAILRGIRDAQADRARGDARGAQLEQRRVHRAPQANLPEQVEPVAVEPRARRKRPRLTPEHGVK